MAGRLFPASRLRVLGATTREPERPAIVVPVQLAVAAVEVVVPRVVRTVLRSAPVVAVVAKVVEAAIGVAVAAKKRRRKNSL